MMTITIIQEKDHCWYYQIRNEQEEVVKQSEVFATEDEVREAVEKEKGKGKYEYSTQVSSN